MAQINKTVLIPIVLFLICFSYLIYNYTNNSLVLDIDFKGGTQIVFESSEPFSESDAEEALKDYNPSIRTGSSISSNTLIVSVSEDVKSADVIAKVKDAGIVFDDYSVQTVGASLGSGFFQQATLSLVLAFFLMAVVIFIIFRAPAVSVYTALCPLFDIIETLAITQFLGIELSLAGFAALLMMVGYSVNDDVLIATRILKSGNNDIEAGLKGAFKTSMTSVFATLAALLCLFLLSISDVFTQIASFLIIGLIVDMLNTWVFNVNVLRWHVSRKGVTNAKAA